MRFAAPLIPGRLVQRYKRFLADIRLETGEMITAHCANPGSMMGLVAPGARVFLSRATNPARKLGYSWELVEIDLGSGPTLVGINTVHPNGLVEEAILDGMITELAGFARLKREVRYGVNSRIDILLEGDDRPACYVEVKNVHMMRRDRHAEFPDSVTARGAKHLGELASQVEAGRRAVMVFLIQYGGAERLTLARDIDPGYGASFDQAIARGVEALAYRCRVNAEGIEVEARVPIDEPGVRS